jgi:threonine dehydrogenase-like Zn-dependent dehydrogenase
MKHLFKSLAAFQQEVPVIHKATQGYGYTYADLPKIFEVINPLLKKHGLGFTQLINGTQIATCLFHVESAESIESKIDIPQGVILKGMNEFQVLGSAITYLRRYALSSMLGLVTDKDTDASGEQVKHEPKIPSIDNTRFQKAIDAISKGEYTVEELTTKFSLTPAQLKTLEV